MSAIKDQSISIFGFPFEKGSKIKGCSLGPQALRIAGLAESLVKLGYQVKDYHDVIMQDEAQDYALMPQSDRLLPHEEVERYCAAIYKKLTTTNLTNTRPLFLGGDHSVSFGSIAAMAKLCAQNDKELVVIWLDAHADFNSPTTSPSGNWHGMPLSFLTGNAEFANRFKTMQFPFIAKSNIYLVGMRSLDYHEKILVKTSGVHVYDMRQIDERGVTAIIQQIITEIARPNVHLHLSFDCDFLDPAIAPGVGTPVNGGASYREAHLIMEHLYDSGLVQSVDVVELNPFLDEKGKSAKLLVELIESLFGKGIV